jgi:hypothetical protein
VHPATLLPGHRRRLTRRTLARPGPAPPTSAHSRGVAQMTTGRHGGPEWAS